MFQAAMLLAQIALIMAADANGWTATPTGGALALASIWCLGANLGWFFRDIAGGGGR